jgi:hypothetical protein
MVLVHVCLPGRASSSAGRGRGKRPSRVEVVDVGGVIVICLLRRGVVPSVSRDLGLLPVRVLDVGQGRFGMSSGDAKREAGGNDSDQIALHEFLLSVRLLRLRVVAMLRTATRVEWIRIVVGAVSVSFTLLREVNNPLRLLPVVIVVTAFCVHGGGAEHETGGDCDNEIAFHHLPLSSRLPSVVTG